MLYGYYRDTRIVFTSIMSYLITETSLGFHNLLHSLYLKQQIYKTVNHCSLDHWAFLQYSLRALQSLLLKCTWLAYIGAPTLCGSRKACWCYCYLCWQDGGWPGLRSGGQQWHTASCCSSCLFHHWHTERKRNAGVMLQHARNTEKHMCTLSGVWC